MDLELGHGHGFIPRIGEENYKAVDRCVGPADLFNPAPREPTHVGIAHDRDGFGCLNTASRSA